MIGRPQTTTALWRRRGTRRGAGAATLLALAAPLWAAAPARAQQATVLAQGAPQHTASPAQHAPSARRIAAAPRRVAPVPFPTGTVLPIRFLHSLVGGRERVGTPLLVQTLGALVQEGCVVVEPFTQVRGHVIVSRGGGRFGRPGELALAFDSLEVAPGRWQPVGAVLDSLEYAAPGELSDSGELAGGRRPGRGRLVRSGAIIGASAVTEEVGVVAVALLEGWRLVRRGPRAAILSGEVASLRLTSPLAVQHRGECVSAAAHPDLAGLPVLPRFAPRTSDDAAGRHPGDPVNVLLLGSAPQIDSAFVHAGWVRAQMPSLRSLARGVTAAVVERSAVGAPVSTQYFEGRRQDMTYELSGPNARLRHHVRLWLLDARSDVWVAAADQDVGLVVKPFKRTATHRIAPDVDNERDLITRELEASGCADLLAYATLPGAGQAGRNASGQHFDTDGRAAILRLRSCPPKR